MEPDIQSRIHEWAENEFGSPVRIGPLLWRVEEELQELYDAMGCPPGNDKSVEEVKYQYGVKEAVTKELADVFITLARLAGVLEIDLLKEASLKQDVNERRRWEAHGDGTGHHIRST
jgi:NTP pyrophosphatase (non-canonical NTP hydrolase)